MDLFEAIDKSRSIRRFDKTKEVPDELIEKALGAALWAPNSSNTQTWDFFWVITPEKKQKLIEACLNQSAARSAKHLLVFTSHTKNWKRSLPFLKTWVKNANAPQMVIDYYEKLIPLTYQNGPLSILTPIKFLLFHAIGFFKPIVRRPITNRDLEEIGIKSSALACQNFVLALTAQGLSSCMMEGIDEIRIKKLLKLPWGLRVTMVIAVGYEGEKGTWGPAFRIPKELVIHKI